MIYQDFQRIAEQWKNELIPDPSISFRELLEKIKLNERIRNVISIYSLSDESSFMIFNHVAAMDVELKQVLIDLYFALEVPESSFLYAAAQMIRSQTFYRMMENVAKHEVPRENVTYEIRRVFQSMVRQYNLEKERRVKDI